jgi:hypothetical protein
MAAAVRRPRVVPPGLARRGEVWALTDAPYDGLGLVVMRHGRWTVWQTRPGTMTHLDGVMVRRLADVAQTVGRYVGAAFDRLAHALNPLAGYVHIAVGVAHLCGIAYGGHKTAQTLTDATCPECLGLARRQLELAPFVR